MARVYKVDQKGERKKVKQLIRKKKKFSGIKGDKGA